MLVSSDHRRDKYFYIDNRTGEVFWYIPPVIKLFGIKLREMRAVLTEDEAALKVQHTFRALRARRMIRAMVKDLFQKRFGT